MSISRALMADLRRSLGPNAVVTDAADLPGYGDDWRAPRGVPGVVARAATADDVVTTLRFAARHGVPVVPRGAGTNAAASFRPTPARILLDLRRMDRIVRVDPERREAVVQPGVINDDLVARVAPLGLLYAADPASAHLSSLGGNIMTNAGGPHCLKYGVTYHQVSELDCVLMGGDTLRLNAADAGPDLLGVVIGSEGTLAVVVEATLRLRPLPAATRTLLAAFADATAAAAAVFAILATGVVPSALEYVDAAAIRMFDNYAPSGYPADAAALLLIDLDGDADAAASDLATVESVLRPVARNVWRANEAAARASLWRGRLHAAQAIVATGKQHYLGDTTAPPSRIADLQQAIEVIAARNGLSIPTLGHAGDGNLHPVILFDDDPRQRAAAERAEEELIEAALGLGGTITGEHGVGADKRQTMRRQFQPAELAAMRAVKAAFDPKGLLNPDILLPDPAPDEPDLPQFAAAARAAIDARREGGRWPTNAPDLPASPAHGMIAIDPDNRTFTADAATPLEALHEALATHGLRSPLPDEPETLGAVVTAGNPMARASLRDTLLGVQAALPDGPTVRFGRGLLKDVAGYDLKRLYIGGGTRFGRLLEATFQAHVPPGR
ncbi:MAG TPA: FAD-linked oxidase C-terminal domain-containing protein [Thermomicrobiales bacterium]|nr:FAD-linked oxidase C-terminal domain-containing protein [Thermomicrobiales bacterium]